jgi:transposase
MTSIANHIQTQGQSAHHLVAIDIAKDTLEVLIAGSTSSFPLGNDPAGLSQLAKRLRALQDPAFVICEATGGYERPLLAALHQAGIAVTLLNPSRLRAFAMSEGVKARE